MNCFTDWLLLVAFLFLVAVFIATGNRRLKTPGQVEKNTDVKADCVTCVFNPTNSGCTLERPHNFFATADGWHCCDYHRR